VTPIRGTLNGLTENKIDNIVIPEVVFSHIDKETEKSINK
jgi:hypothetical protein